jgi:hypothetical protein
MRRRNWESSLTALLLVCMLGSSGCRGALIEPTRRGGPVDEEDAGTVPGIGTAPGNLRVLSSDQTSIRISWSAPAEGRVVTYGVYLDGQPVDSVTARTYTFEDLRCGTLYTLEVDAESDDGVSERASIRVSTTPCASKPSDAGGPPIDAGSPPIDVIPTGAFVAGVCAYSTKDFQRIAAMGVKGARMDRPSPAIIESARTFGIEVLPIAAYGFPDLSGSSDYQIPPLPQNRGAWAKRMVDTWRSMKVPPRVIEVWNEPWGLFWKPKPDPAAYLELVKAFATEAWGVWPNLTILVSADDGSAQYATWRKDLLAADTGGLLKDPRILPTTHNYEEGRAPTAVTKNPCSWDLDRYKCAYNDFKAHGHPDPQVWVTEYGWETNTPAPGYSNHATISEQQQADYHLQALEIFRKSGMVAGAYSYMVQSNQNWNYNWLRPDNSEKPITSAIKSYMGANP